MSNSPAWQPSDGHGLLENDVRCYFKEAKDKNNRRGKSHITSHVVFSVFQCLSPILLNCFRRKLPELLKIHFYLLTRIILQACRVAPISYVELSGVMYIIRINDPPSLCIATSSSVAPALELHPPSALFPRELFSEILLCSSPVAY